MFQRMMRLLALAVGAALLALGLALPGAGAPALAQGLPPRPTPVPVAPTDEPDNGGGHKAPPAPGRITGTVIDSRTGAPTSGVAVRVGEALVTSDPNGNYDLNGLAPGSYVVSLELAAGQGQPAQGPVSVSLEAGQTVVQHLFFRSPEPPRPAPPSEPVPPSVPEAPFSMAPPAALPVTSESGGSHMPLAACGVALIVAGLALRRRG